MAFHKATKKQAKLRMAINGPSGSGKTYTALLVAKGLGGKIALIDTEHESASKYASGDKPEDVTKGKFAFDTDTLTNFAPKNYVTKIREAEAAGYDVIVIDSLTHAWNGTGGVLEIVDAAASRARGNTYAGWKEGTPAQNELIEAILQSRCHVIATMRAKTEYALEVGSNGKTAPKKIGMAPVQRDGMEYEFDVSGFIDTDHVLCIDKSRCPEIAGQTYKKPGIDLGKQLAAWLSDGEPVAAPAPAAAPAPVVAAPTIDATPAFLAAPSAGPSEAEKIVAWFRECDSLDKAKDRGREVYGEQKKYSDPDWALIKDAIGVAVKRLSDAAANGATAPVAAVAADPAQAQA